MITSTEANTILWKEVNASPLKAAISGGVFKNVRPTGSINEDVVTNIITAAGSEFLIQNCPGNINIHIPSLLVNDGKDYVPDEQRLQELGKIAADYFKGVYRKEYTIYIENTGTIQDTNKVDWFFNLRVRIKFHNTIKNYN